MIADGEHIDGVEKRHYLPLKSETVIYNRILCKRPVKYLSRLLSGISSDHHKDFYFLNCFNSYSSENSNNSKNMNKYVIRMIVVV